jgi:DNA-binding NtrC family response regulator
MGLSVVYGIVKDCQGEIFIRSKQGEGTTVDVYLPQIDAPEDASPESSPTFVGHREKILIVDDEPAILEMNTERLQYLGYQVTALTSSRKALEVVAKNPNKFDLIITDMTMPEMSGVALAEHVLRIRPDMPIILCTGFTDAVTPEEVKEMGIREFVMKPIAIEELSLIMLKLLETQSNNG